MHTADSFRTYPKLLSVSCSLCVACSLQEEAHPVFEQAACYGKAIAVKAAAIEALAVTAFTASDDPAVVDKCMTGFANLWKTGMPACFMIYARETPPMRNL